MFSVPSQKKTVFWPVKSKVTIGDRIYLYLAAPHKQIGFVGEVCQTDLTEDNVYANIKIYFKQQPEQKGETRPFMKINKKIKSIPIKETSPLALATLKRHGLKGMLIGPRKLDNSMELLQYIKEHLS